MKKAIKYAKKNPNETKWTSAGLGLGALTGLSIGVVGITSLNGAKQAATLEANVPV